jgi:hypothetical protein
MTNRDHLPLFASNRHDLNQTVGDEVLRLFRVLREQFAQAPNIAIATAYINPSGFNLIADELERAPRVRILLGAEPEQKTVRALTDSAERDTRLDEALKQHETWLLAERDAMGFTREASAQAQRLVSWLQAVDEAGESRVDVRRYTEGFLHGKAFIADNPVIPGVLAGSSNMTYAGLRLNAELNLGYPLGDVANGAKVIDWFEHYWSQSEPYDLGGVYSKQREDHSPWTIFLRMLQELYGAGLAEEAPRQTRLNLTQFQSDGVARMQRLLDEVGGVLVADEVGLGKTFLAGEMIARAVQENRQRVAIICPAALKTSMWDKFLEKYDFSRRVKVFSYEELRNRMDQDRSEYQSFRDELDEYALVVIDEAHNLRNATAQRSEAVDRALVGGGTPKKTILLTATPVNNSLMDLDTLIRYFVRDDARFAAIGIPSIRKYIKHAQDLGPEQLTAEHLFTLLDQVAVRRTRKFVKENYPGQTIEVNGKSIPVTFPTPEVYRIDYALDEDGQELVDRMVYALDLPNATPLVSHYADRRHDPGRLMLSRYTPSAYSRSQHLESYQVSNAGLLRSALLKRLESSPRALANTLKTLMNAHEAFLDGMRAGYVLTGEALRDWTSAESSDFEAFLIDLDEKAMQQVDATNGYHLDALREDVKSDLALLTEILEIAERAAGSEDPKAKKLIEQLTEIAEESRRPDRDGIDSGDRRKVIIFSSFADTILDLFDRVGAALESASSSALVDYKGRLAEAVMGTQASVMKIHQRGGVDQARRARIIEGFAPETAGEVDDEGNARSQDLYDIILTTDVLAEGVNLQQAGRIINYDLPWNPMRIVQRHGRIDRIGSKHKTVRMGLFFPTSNLDTLLHLEETLERKLAQAAAAVGTGEVLPGRAIARDINFFDKREQIQDLFDGKNDLLENRGSSAAISGEEYRRRLFTAMSDLYTKHDVERLPYGSGSGFINPRMRTNGYVFCIKIADHPQPWFRFVPVDKEWNLILEKGAPSVIDDTLTSLVAADPIHAEVGRIMDDRIYDKAFDAWVVAKENAHAAWEYLTDGTNLAPEAPKSFRDSYTLVSRSGGHLGPESQRDLLQRLNSVPSKRVERAVRQLLNGNESESEKVNLIRDEVIAAGLLPVTVPPGLPAVSEAEVRLVTWMAVSAGNPNIVSC